MKQNENPGVKFYYPYAKPRGRKRKRVEGFENDASYDETSLTKEQRDWNSSCQHIRARVEDPFGLIKMKWKALGKAWGEDEEQQDYLVHIAFAIHNWSIPLE